MINIDDFRDENGRVDWKAYDRAKINAGEKCYKCKAYIISIDRPKIRLCSSCNSFDNDREEVSHSSLIRCPYCKHSQEVEEEDFGGAYDDNSTEIYCDICEQQYEVTRTISISYTSPPLANDPEEEEEEDEGEPDEED